MKPLNIPLAGSRETARHHRRAVWRWGVPLILLLFLWGSVRLYGTRNPFANTIPEETVLMIHLRLTRPQWSVILDRMGNEVLTRTGITLKELSPFIEGSIALFLTKEGETIVGVEGSFDEKVRQQFEAHGLTIQEVGRRRFLLAENAVSLVPSESQIGRSERILPRFAGSIISFDAGAPHTTIRIRGNTISLDLPWASSSTSAPLLNDRVIFAGTFSGDAPIVFPSFLDNVFAFASGGTTFKETFQTVGSEGTLSLFDDGSYFISLSSNIPLALLEKTLLLQAQLREPMLASRKLLDGTSIQELRLNETPALTEEVENANWTILRLDSKTTTFFAGKKKDGHEVFFTDSADALIQKTSSNLEKQAVSSCGSSQKLKISNQAFIRYLQNGKTYFSTPLPLSNTDFVNVGIDKDVFGVKIRLCVDKNQS